MLPANTHVKCVEVGLAVCSFVPTVSCSYVDIVPFSRNRVSIISEAGDNLKSYVTLFDSCYVVVCICLPFYVFLSVVTCLVT